MRFLSLILFALNTNLLVGAEHAFLLQDIDSQQFLIQEGDVSSRKSPYCTFNIPLSLIAFETNILHSPISPVWPCKMEYEEEYLTWNDSFPQRWAGLHSPISWMQNSCVWYSQAITQKLGMHTLKDYVNCFSYGNQNLEGDIGLANGITRSWIGSSLRISPYEQVLLIHKLLKKELPLSEHTYECVQAVLFVEQLPNGMKLYGKTGGGDYANGRAEPKQKIRWFVGWVEMEKKRLAFAYRILASEEEPLLLELLQKKS